MFNVADPSPVRRGSLWREGFAQALEVVRTHRMRSALLILGVAIGITTILMMVTVLNGLGQKINDDMVSANRPYVYVQRYDVLTGDLDEDDILRRKKIEPEDARAAAAECASVETVCYFVEPPSGTLYQATYQGEKTPPIGLFGSGEAFPRVFSFDLESGRFFSAEEVRRTERICVLGYGPANDLFDGVNPLGKSIRVEGRSYRVVGTCESRNHIIGAISDNFVVLPHTTFRKDFGTDLDFESFAATTRPGYTLEDGVEEITALLRLRRGVRPGEDNNFVVMTSESFVDLVRKVTVPIALVLTVIASIGLIVGGIGVMNIMLISVTERTREVGVRMALGAEKGDILLQFLLEAATLTGMGGVVGTILGTLAAYGVSQVIQFPFHVSPFWTITSIVFSLGVGVIFGLYPARRAAHMDPVEALRFE